jgi:hypothetical protein
MSPLIGGDKSFVGLLVMGGCRDLTISAQYMIVGIIFLPLP